MPMIFSGEYRFRFILTSLGVSRFYHNSNFISGSAFGGQVKSLCGELVGGWISVDWIRKLDMLKLVWAEQDFCGIKAIFRL